MANKNSSVTVIINNYNYARYLKDAIESALCQTCNNLEVIVVDDGSTDNSREVISRFGERIIPVLKANGGQASAFNAGLVRSHGAAIIFLDADDALAPDIVAQVARVFQDQPTVVKVQYRMEIMDAQSRRSGKIKPERHLPMPNGDMRRAVLAFPEDITWMATSGNAFAASVLHRIFPIPEEGYGRVNADSYLSHLTPLFGPVVSLDHVGAFYRVHPRNNYERSEARLDLPHIRQSINVARETHKHIKRFARQLGLCFDVDSEGDLISVSYIANRLVSLKLAPSQHPIVGDRVGHLFRLGVSASLRRFDVSPLMRLMFVLWFALVSIAPEPVARWLAERFFFPEKRQGLNRLLGVLHNAH